MNSEAIAALYPGDRPTNGIRNASLVVSIYAPATLTTRQRESLTSFCDSVGRKAFIESALLQYVNDAEFDKAAAEFSKQGSTEWRERNGLNARQSAEANWFLMED